MGEQRFLVVRLSSLGDIVHALPAVAALRRTLSGARIDWVVERRWRALVECATGVTSVITLDRTSWRAIRACVRELRAARYTCAIDFQGLYKSASLAAFSGAPVRIGFDRRFAREAGASVFYTQRVGPAAAHVIEQNLALAQAAGARTGNGAPEFALREPPEAVAESARLLAETGIERFVLLSPGGGWRSKCWPAERYAAVARELAARHGYSTVVNCGPGEEEMAAAFGSASVVVSPDVPVLMALARRAACVVAGDSGPLHLAAALGTPVVALFGPTDPARNGPWSREDIVVRNAGPAETSYKRGNEPSQAMLSISVEQALEAVERRLGLRG